MVAKLLQDLSQEWVRNLLSLGNLFCSAEPLVGLRGQVDHCSYRMCGCASQQHGGPLWTLWSESPKWTLGNSETISRVGLSQGGRDASGLVFQHPAEKCPANSIQGNPQTAKNPTGGAGNSPEVPLPGAVLVSAVCATAEQHELKLSPATIHWD